MQGASFASARDEIGRDHAARSSARRLKAEAVETLLDSLVGRIMAIILLLRL